MSLDHGGESNVRMMLAHYGAGIIAAVAAVVIVAFFIYFFLETK